MNLAPHRGTGKAQPEYEYLAQTSPKDKPWDVRRGQADGVEETLLGSGEKWLERWGERVHECCPWLKFAGEVNKETGEFGLKLKQTFFCKVRYCPMCMPRRSGVWFKRFDEALPKIEEALPHGRWLFLTLTHRNCRIEDLRDELGAMSKAWQRLLKRKEFRDIAGWIRSVEITPGEQGPGQAHPHFHVLLFVRSTYFKGGHYVKAEQWVQAWRESMRLDYDPVCHISAVKMKDKQRAKELGPKAALRAAVCETLKYSVKVADMLKNPEWFLQVCKQTVRTRAVASGGLLKNALREDDVTQEDLLLADEEAAPEEDAPTLTFNYDRPSQHYRRKRSA